MENCIICFFLANQSEDLLLLWKHCEWQHLIGSSPMLSSIWIISLKGQDLGIDYSASIAADIKHSRKSSKEESERRDRKLQFPIWPVGYNRNAGIAKG